MAIFQLQAKDAVVRIGGSQEALNCVQSFNWDSNLNAEKLTALGDENYTAQTITPEVSASFEVQSTGSLSAFLARMVYDIDPVTGEFEPPTGNNTRLFRERDLERAVCDLIESKKANEVFDRSTLIPRAYLKSVQISAKSDGVATEQYQFDADLLELFRAPKHDLVSVPVTRDTTGTPSTTVVVPGAYDLSAWTIYCLDIDGDRVYASDLTVAGQEVTLNAAPIAAGRSVTLGSKLALVLYKTVPGTFPTITYPTTARFVKADHINIWLVNPTATFLVGGQTRTVEAHLAAGVDFNTIPFSDADLFLRVQSMDLNVDLGREALREIRKNDRGNPIFYRAAKYPLNITCDISAMERDASEWAKMQGKSATDVLNLAGFENKEWMIVSRYFKGNVALQTVGLLNATVENPGSRVQVGGRAEMTWKLAGSKFAVQGAAV